MISSIIYKEFLKSYKIVLLFFVVIAWALFDTYTDNKNIMYSMDATSAILNITQMGRFDYNNIKYICIFFAIALGTSQFYPEVTNARIRLFLHLPMSHFKLITILVFIGLFFLSSVFIVIGYFYSLILNSFYPIEIYEAIYSRLFPLFLASILCYITTMIVFLEPYLVKKIAYVLISYFVLDIYLILSQKGYFVSYIYDYTILAIIAIYILSVYEVFTSYTKGYIK